MDVVTMGEIVTSLSTSGAASELRRRMRRRAPYAPSASPELRASPNRTITNALQRSENSSTFRKGLILQQNTGPSLAAMPEPAILWRRMVLPRH
jgi:hypothetical protein